MHSKHEQGEVIEIEADWLDVTDGHIVLSDAGPRQHSDLAGEVAECFGEGRHPGPWKLTLVRLTGAP